MQLRNQETVRTSSVCPERLDSRERDEKHGSKDGKNTKTSAVKDDKKDNKDNKDSSNPEDKKKSDGKKRSS